MKVLKFLNKRISKKDKKILEEYEKGNIIQVDNSVDNKQFFKENESRCKSSN